jgi:hypothetical protein
MVRELKKVKERKGGLEVVSPAFWSSEKYSDRQIQMPTSKMARSKDHHRT